MTNKSVIVLITGIVFLGLLLSGCEKPQPKQAETPKAATGTQPAQPAQGAKPESGPSLEVKSHIKQGLSYVSNAKNARGKVIFEENIDNAIKEFSLAIQKDPGYADAYSIRAVAYMQQKKFNKASEDLKKAKELNPDSASQYGITMPASIH